MKSLTPTPDLKLEALRKKHCIGGMKGQQAPRGGISEYWESAGNIPAGKHTAFLQKPASLCDFLLLSCRYANYG